MGDIPIRLVENKMKIPKKVKVGGFIYPVIENADVANEGNVYGSTHLRRQKIFLEPSETQQKKEQTFIHEVLHAIWNQIGLNTRMKDTPKLEEEIIDGLSHGLYQVLKDNDLLK